jgi:hypothetical protein
MWKLKVKFYCKRNIKKQNVMFTVLPTFGYLNGLYKRKTEHSKKAERLLVVKL